MYNVVNVITNSNWEITFENISKMYFKSNDILNQFITFFFQFNLIFNNNIDYRTLFFDSFDS